MENVEGLALSQEGKPHTHDGKLHDIQYISDSMKANLDQLRHITSYDLS